ncbi:MAG: mechanosensitive ion channel, partial [Hydrogenovibrio sp.]|nr:mechanosensitive ion channel [Hydrogenovibrio sp.]
SPLLLIACLASTTPVMADSQTTLKQAVETQERTKEVLSQTEQDKQKIRVGSTPLSTLLAILEDTDHNDYKSAAQYLDLRYLPISVTEVGGPELLKQLMIIWNQQNMLDLSSISNDPNGASDDGLPPYRDLIGYLNSSRGKVPVYLQKVPDPNVGYLWKISNHTVLQVPRLWEEFGYPEWVKNLSEYLPEFEIFYLQNWQVAGLLLILIVGWYLAKTLSTILAWAWIRLRPEREPVRQFLLKPFRYAFYIYLINLGVERLGLSLQAKVILTSGILNYIAVWFIIAGLIELISQRLIRRHPEDSSSRAIIRPLATAAKILVIILLGLNWLSDAGYSLTTVLTGLGIGSLAIALAAQKTLENMFEAFTLYIARPVKPGDFCQFGDIKGTVEEIGLRSTQIRKLDRTIVHVPNAIFASKEVENFAEIDRRLYRRELRLRLDTTPEQLRLLLIELKKLVYAHPKTLSTDERIRFEEIERDAYLVVINVYIGTAAMPEFKAIAEDLNFHILDILQQLDIHLATPEQRIIISHAEPQNEAGKQQAAKEIEALIEQQSLPFPDFSDAEKTKLENTLSYPPKGSGNSEA